MLPAASAAARSMWAAGAPRAAAAAAAVAPLPAGARAAGAAGAAARRAYARLVFAAHGEPEDVLELQQGGDGGALGPGDVRLDLVAVSHGGGGG
jgi:hypothetical protein